ncbi:MAG: hypothetical protein QXU93_08150 [Thermoproteus sp.]
MKTKLIISDTDLDGLADNIIAQKVAKEIGVPYYAYSHFPTPNSQQPGTTPSTLNLDAVSQYLAVDFGGVWIFDIPPPIQTVLRANLINQLKNLVSLGVGVEIYDVVDHATEEHWRQLLSSGVKLSLYSNGYELKRSFAWSHGVYGGDVDGWALIGSVADFDPAVRDVNEELEERVVKVDQAYKFAMPNVDEIKSLIPRYGSAGAVAVYVTQRNMGPEEFIEWGIGLYEKLPPDKKIPENVVYETTAHGVVIDAVANKIPPGLTWKTASETARRSKSWYAVVYNVPPPPGKQGTGIIVAKYWRVGEEVARAIDEAVDAVGKKYGVTPFGHSGAKSLVFPLGTDTKEIAKELVALVEHKLSQSLSSVTQLVNVDFVARAVQRDFSQIREGLDEIKRILSTRVSS